MLVTFEQKSTSRNSIDEDVTAWAVYKRAFCERKFTSALETIESKQVVGRSDVELKVIYDASLTSTMRFKFGTESTYYYVREVQGWQREGYTLIKGERRDNDA